MNMTLQPFDDRLADALLAYEAQHRSAGSTTDSPGDASTHVPADLRQRLERDMACIDLLRDMRAELAHEHEPPGNHAAELLAGECNGGPRQIGRFEILATLGAGGFGIVYRAFDPSTRREVAVKVPRIDVLASDELTSRFHQEAQAAARLEHPNIVSVLEAGTDGLLPYIVTAYSPGETLADWLKRHGTATKPAIAARWLRDLTGAMAHAHKRGVLHRDIKPSNILLVRAVQGTNGTSFENDDEVVPKLMDFGLAKLTTASQEMTRSGAMLGTLRYMSPEQAAGRSREIGPASDVYSLGAVLYELLTGSPPFAAESDLELLRQIQVSEPSRISGSWGAVPRDLETVCLKCLEKDPARRYPTADALAEDLRRYLNGETIRARRATLSEQLNKWVRRNPQLAALIAVIITSLTALSAFLMYGNARISASVAAERASEERLAQQLYASEMRQAADVMTLNNAPRARELLGHYASPGTGLDRREFAWHWLAGRLAGPRRILARHSNAVYRLSLSSDELHIATGCGDGRVRVWKITDGSLAWQFDCHSEVNEVAYSPDGRWLAAGCEDGTLRLFDAPTGRLTQSWVCSNQEITAVAFGPNSNCLYASDERHVRAFRVSENEPVAENEIPDGMIHQLALSSDGEYLAVAGRTGLFYWSTAHLTDSAPKRVGEEYRSLDFVPGLHEVLASPFSGRIQGFDLDAGKQLIRRDRTDDVGDVLTIRPDGRIIVAGVCELSSRAPSKFMLAAFLADGELDPDFGDAGVVITPITHRSGDARAVAVQEDGKIVLAGLARTPLGRRDVALARYHPDGRPDAGFGNHGLVITSVSPEHDSVAAAMQVQPDGRIVIAGWAYVPRRVRMLARYQSDGSLDQSFADGGIAVLDEASLAPQANEALDALAIDADGRIVTGGWTAPEDNVMVRTLLVARHAPDGTLEADWKIPSIASPAAGLGCSQTLAVFPEPDGRVTALGRLRDGDSHQLAVVHYPSRGASSAPLLEEPALMLIPLGAGEINLQCVARQEDGKIVAGGSVRVGDHTEMTVLRAGIDGKLDESFGTHGRTNIWFGRGDDNARALAIQRDGRILVTGSTKDQGSQDLAIARLNTDGTLDGEFKHAAREVSRLDFDSACIGKVRVSPDRREVVVATDDSLHLRDRRTLVESTVFWNPGGRIWDVAFDARGESLWTVDEQGCLAQWTCRKNQLPLAIAGAAVVHETTAPITAWELSPDEGKLICGADDGQVTVVSAESGEVLWTWNLAVRGDVTSLATSPGSVFAAYKDGTLVELDDATGDEKSRRQLAHEKPILAASADHRKLAITYRDSPELSLLELSSEQPSLWTAVGEPEARCLAFGDSDRSILLGSQNRLVLFDAVTGTRQPASIDNTAFLDLGVRGRQVLAAPSRPQITLLNLPQLEVAAAFPTGAGGATSVARTPDGRNIASYGRDGVLRVWEVRGGQQLLAIEPIKIELAGGLRFSLDGRHLLAIEQQSSGRHRILRWSCAVNADQSAFDVPSP